MRILGIALVLVLVLAGSPVFASIVASTTVPQSLGGVLTLVDLSGAPLGPFDYTGTGFSIDFVPGGTPNTGVVIGSLATYYAAPIINSSGDPYLGKYLSSGNAASSITIHFNDPQSALAFLWGSIDTFNGLTISFNNGVATYTGTQAAAAASILPNGNQGFGGSAYVAIHPDIAGGTFNDVTFISDPSYSFEIADIRATTGSFGVPDGGMTLMLLGAALLGLETLRRKLRV